MTFFKQMVLLMSAFLIIVLFSVMLLNFNTTTKQTQEQLYSNAQDTASSLSLSLGTTKAEMSSIETMINAVFDSGYYESIILYDMQHKELYSRSHEFVNEDEVPKWFMNFFTLDILSASAHVSNGWTPIGILEVTSLKSEAYSSLYKSFIHISNSFIIISLITFIALFMFLQFILKSLKKVEEQAYAISKNEFFINESIPYTTEFKNVTIAMNAMVSKVKDIFDKEALTLKKYHEVMYHDEVTKLSNRRFLIIKLNEFLKSDMQNSSGTIFFLSLNNLIESNKSIGHKNVDETLMSFAKLIKDSVKNISEHICTRLNGTEFIIVLPNVEVALAMHHAQNISKMSRDIFKSFGAKELELYTSVMHYDSKDTIGSIFSKADFSISKCKMKEAFSIYTHTQDSCLSIVGKQEFSQIIAKAMQENRLTFALQAVINSSNNEIIHEEAYLRLIDKKGNVLSAGHFMPMIFTLNLQVDVDKYIIKHIISQDAFRQHPTAINITIDFVKDISNIEWLKNLLQTSNLKYSLHFELSNSDVIENLDATMQLCNMLNNLGHFLGIDRFSITQNGLDYLQKLKPDYLKVNYSYLHDLVSSENGMNNNALINIIDTLGIQIIVCAVETQDEKIWLTEHNFILLQGSYIKDTELIEIL